MLYKLGLKYLRNRFWLYITWKNKQKKVYVILVYAWDTAQLMGESTRLVCVQLMERDFENVFNKNDGDFRQLQCKNQIQRDVHCTKKYLDDNLVFDVSLYKTFSFIFGRGLDFGSPSCVSKMCFYTIFSSFHIFDYICTYLHLTC